MSSASGVFQKNEVSTLSSKLQGSAQPSTAESLSSRQPETRNDDESKTPHSSKGPSKDRNLQKPDACGRDKSDASDESLTSTERLSLMKEVKSTFCSPTKQRKTFSTCLTDLSCVDSPSCKIREQHDNEKKKSRHHQRQYSLASLASASPVLDALDSPQWNKLFNDDIPLQPPDRVDETHQGQYFSAEAPFQPPPQHDPLRNMDNESSQYKEKRETGLMDLLGDAFDNLGEDDHYSLDDLGVCSSPLAPKNRMLLVTQGGSVHRDRQDIDITLPTLQHTRSHSSFVGDISPIKIAMHETKGSGGHQRMYSLTQPLAFDADHSRNPSNVELSTLGAEMVLNPAHASQRSGEGEGNKRDCVLKEAFVLQSSRGAFERCAYLLPCLRVSRLHGEQPQDGKATIVNDVLIASRRVEAAICAFGGNSRPITRCGASIFRPREALSHLNPFRDNIHYQAKLSSRYFFRTESRLSWDVEENPPVSIANTGFQPQRPSSGSSSQRRNLGLKKTPKRVLPIKEHLSISPPGIVNVVSSGKLRPSGNAGPTLSMIAQSSGTEPPKMKYRCKKCGKPKQNHQCLYREKLTREMGIRVYPAVNAFALNEPGGENSLSLRAMNNFVEYEADTVSTEHVPSPMSNRGEGTHATSTSSTKQVSPGASKTLHNDVHSPQSSLSTLSSTSHFTPQTSTRPHSVSVTRSDSRKRSFDDMSAHGFQQSSPCSAQSDTAVRVLSLRPEQFRAVTPCKNEDPTAYHYHSLPLPAQQRKRLSDSLFYWAQKAHLGSDCALVLRDARDKSEWDQAVAELTAQVLVAFHCEEGDLRFDGLHSYLLSIGIAC